MILVSGVLMSWETLEISSDFSRSDFTAVSTASPRPSEMLFRSSASASSSLLPCFRSIWVSLLPVRISWAPWVTASKLSASRMPKYSSPAIINGMVNQNIHSSGSRMASRMIFCRRGVLPNCCASQRTERTTYFLNSRQSRKPSSHCFALMRRT